MVPKDPMTLRNQAVDLWSANGLDPISLGKALEMPDPYEYAKNLLMWQLIQKGAIPPQMMFPDFGAPPAQLPQQYPGTGGVPVSPPGNQDVQNPQAPQGSNEAVQQQGKQLLESVPVK